MCRVLILLLLTGVSSNSFAGVSDSAAVEQAARNYIESQHLVLPEKMSIALHKKLKKRTYWQDENGDDFVMETDYDTMIKVAKTYNLKGDKFPPKPTVEIKILDIDQRVASVKLTADEWVDYMHLFKNTKGEWKIINVLWQYHDTSRQSRQK